MRKLRKLRNLQNDEGMRMGSWLSSLSFGRAQGGSTHHERQLTLLAHFVASIRMAELDSKMEDRTRARPRWNGPTFR